MVSATRCAASPAAERRRLPHRASQVAGGDPSRALPIALHSRARGRNRHTDRGDGRPRALPDRNSSRDAPPCPAACRTSGRVFAVSRRPWTTGVGSGPASARRSSPPLSRCRDRRGAARPSTNSPNGTRRLFSVQVQRFSHVTAAELLGHAAAGTAFGAAPCHRSETARGRCDDLALPATRRPTALAEAAHRPRPASRASAPVDALVRECSPVDASTSLIVMGDGLVCSDDIR